MPAWVFSVSRAGSSDNSVDSGANGPNGPSIAVATYNSAMVVGPGSLCSEVLEACLADFAVKDRSSRIRCFTGVRVF